MMLFLIFLFVDLSVVGIFYAVYGRRRTYSEGMLMGVHLPESAVSGEEVGRLMERYHVRTKRFYFWNLAAVILMGGLCFWRESVFIIVWSVWLLEMCIGAIVLLNRTHRKLYDLKVERGWIGSTGSRIMAADTKTAAQSAESGIRPRWHILFLMLILLPCLFPRVREYLNGDEGGWILLLCSLAVGAAFGVLHAALLRMPNKVYSEDSGLNLEVNRMQKNVWSWIMTGCGFFNAAAYLSVILSMNDEAWISSGAYIVYVVLEGMISSGAYIVYVVLEGIPIVFFLLGFLYIQHRKERLLAQNTAPLYTDDDVYWKNGWYSNPNDKRVFVQDWACSWNYTVNMARPAGKAWMAAGIAVTAVFLIWLCVEMVKIDFVPIRMEVQEDGISITSGYTDLSLSYGEILGVRLINELPEDEYRRTNGVSDSRQNIGRFKGKETGKCRMFLYTGYEPILEIDTEDGPVYINSETDGETENWYEEIHSFY